MRVLLAERLELRPQVIDQDVEHVPLVRWRTARRHVAPGRRQPRVAGAGAAVDRRREAGGLLCLQPAATTLQRARLAQVGAVGLVIAEQRAVRRRRAGLGAGLGADRGHRHAGQVALWRVCARDADRAGGRGRRRRRRQQGWECPHDHRAAVPTLDLVSPPVSVVTDACPHGAHAAAPAAAPRSMPPLMPYCTAVAGCSLRRRMQLQQQAARGKICIEPCGSAVHAHRHSRRLQ
eukprot:SAG22_NODE_104_length_20159_cov_5.877517_23_plen_234_part_00